MFDIINNYFFKFYYVATRKYLLNHYFNYFTILKVPHGNNIMLDCSKYIILK